MRQDRSINQIMKVSAVNGNTITFETPFHITFPVAYQAQLTRFNGTVLTGVGVEDLCVMGGEGGDWHGGIVMMTCEYSWIKNVEAYWCGGTTVGFYATYRCELRDSYIHEGSWPFPGGGGYLVGLNYGASDNLVENNIMWQNDKEIVMRATGGGNVVAYNYMDDAWIGSYPMGPEAGVNAGHYTTPHFELLEGNYSQNYKGDSYWGNSIYITAFRNQLSGIRAGARGLSSYGFLSGVIYPYGDYWGRLAVDVQGGSYYTNFVGNVLGTQGQKLLGIDTAAHGFGYTQTAWVYEALDASIDNAAHSNVGMWNMGDYQNASGWVWNANTYQTQLREGNWDWYTQTQKWLGVGGRGTSNITTPQTIPNSLYLTSKPAFFGDCPWPWVDPSTGATTTLPAKARFEGIVNPCGGSSVENEKGPCRKMSFALLCRQMSRAIAFDYMLQNTGAVRLDIFNTRGQKVSGVINDRQSAGTHTAEWNADGHAPGIYLCRLTGVNEASVLKFVLR